MRYFESITGSEEDILVAHRTGIFFLPFIVIYQARNLLLAKLL
jgi:hypothetical protein